MLGELQQRVLRLTYRKQHSYVTKSNQTRVVKTPGGKLVYEYTKKHASGQKCPVTEKKIQGVFFILSATSENIRYFLRGQVCYRNPQTKSFLQLLELPYLLDSSKYEVFCRNESSSQPGNTLDVKM